MRIKTIPIIALAIISGYGMANAKPISVPIRYHLAKEIEDVVKSAGNSKLLEAVISVDDKNNAIVINDESRSAAGLMKKIKALDVRPELIKLYTKITIDGQIKSRPLVFTSLGKPCLISIGEGKEKIELEILPEKAN